MNKQSKGKSTKPLNILVMPLHKQLKGLLCFLVLPYNKQHKEILGFYKWTRLNLPLNLNENEKETFVNELVIANELGLYHWAMKMKMDLGVNMVK